jgi:glycosyltransferase involved in cell wall biosynthesis
LPAFSKSSHHPPLGGRFARRWTHYRGLYFDDTEVESAWLRDRAEIQLPPLDGVTHLRLEGFNAPTAPGTKDAPPPGLLVRVNRQTATRLDSRPGPWLLEFPVPAATGPKGNLIELVLQGVGWTNTLAWLGRVTGLAPLQSYRGQSKNRRLRLQRLSTAGGEVIYDFSNRHAPFSTAFARSHLKLGLNVAGFLTADLGVGESARCMVRAADAAALPVALIDLKLPCKNQRSDHTFAARLGSVAPHGISLFHLDPPAARDIDHHHGRDLRLERYNIGYWAWELPEFPDAWLSCFDYFDEIWCPSDFTRDSIGLKSPLPVITMPHAISFARPTAGADALRARLGLPVGVFLFLVLYDLNSYSERKNPRAAIEAFRRSGLHRGGARLVIKVHSVPGNEEDLASLRSALSDLPGTVVVTETLNRADLTALQAACDCFVSLHRAEGFGLAVAECMYLGKPVITTDWSATREFADVDCALPVPARMVTLERSHGPYARGQQWADPSVDAAADQMRRVADDADLRRHIGEAARRRVEDRLAPTVIGARYRRRLEAIAMF